MCALVRCLTFAAFAARRGKTNLVGEREDFGNGTDFDERKLFKDQDADPFCHVGHVGARRVRLVRTHDLQPAQTIGVDIDFSLSPEWQTQWESMFI